MHIPIEKKKKIISLLFEETKRPNYWEVYLPLEGGNEFTLVKAVCLKCKKYWSVDRKECFYCKSKYYRIKICPKCKKIYPENVIRCNRCQNKGGKKIKTLKMCLNCGKIQSGRKRIFVPITFCSYCGNRENKFEFKIIKIK
ncbi:MAG: hypothetical protein ACKKMO_00735 [Candidatus Nealsonbacteria bacterium]